MASDNNQKAFDVSKAEAFSEKLLTALNYGSLSLMISIGHRTGIFDDMRALPASTSAEVAEASGLNERYVREWLGAMVTAGVIVVDPTSTRYTLPAGLTSATLHSCSTKGLCSLFSGTTNISAYSQPGSSGVREPEKINHENTKFFQLSGFYKLTLAFRRQTSASFQTPFPTWPPKRNRFPQAR